MKKIVQMKIEEEPIDNISQDYLKRIILTDEEGNTKWALKNRYNMLTPFFENDFCISRQNDNNLIFIGEKEGHRGLYVCNINSNEKEPFCSEVKTYGEVEHFEVVNDEIGIVKITNGSYLMNLNEFKPTSDVFDSILGLNDSMIFVKCVTYNENETLFYGNIKANGKIGNFLYDTYNDAYIRTPLLSGQEAPYDFLNQNALEDELEKNVEMRSVGVKGKLKSLTKLNRIKGIYGCKESS